MTKLKFLLALSFVGTALVQAQAVLPPSTGVAKDSTGKPDEDWSIVALNGQIGADPSVTTEGWLNPTTGAWIAPAANKDTSAWPASCCTGTVTYELQWIVNAPSTQKFVVTIYADGVPSVSLNHTNTDEPVDAASGTASIAP
jgi:hypothetical protein